MFFRNFDLINTLISLPAIILALTIHELFHGLAALLMGDQTAKNDGRLSFNPIRHIDPIGMLCLIFLGFGWAKPVMVNPYNFEDPKLGMVVTGFAGPLSNFFQAFAWALVVMPFDAFMVGSVTTYYISRFFWACFSINLSLGVFNMLPIPPLDGSKVFGAVLPRTAYFRFIGGAYQRYTMIIFIFAMYTGILSKIISPIVVSIGSGMLNLASMICGVTY